MGWTVSTPLASASCRARKSGAVCKVVSCVVLAVMLLPSIGAAQAQDWPNRPLTMIIPFAAGGPTDVLGRVMAQYMSDKLGQRVIVENIGGAGGMNGSKRAADAAPDGYTFLLGTVGTHAQNQTLYKKPLYNAESDFTPATLIAEVPIAHAVRKDLPVKSISDFISYTKSNQATMTFGSAGSGSATHLACVLVNAAIGVNITHVPYRGGGPALQDLIAGRLDYLCDIISTTKPQIENGAVKALAILSKERSPVLPDLPTAKEQGLDVEAYTWNAFFLPKGTPDAIVQKLQTAASETMDMPAVKDRLTGLGAVLVTPERRSPKYLATFVQSEIAKWAGPIKAAGVISD